MKGTSASRDVEYDYICRCWALPYDWLSERAGDEGPFGGSEVAPTEDKIFLECVTAVFTKLSARS